METDSAHALSNTAQIVLHFPISLDIGKGRVILIIGVSIHIGLYTIIF